MENIKEKALQLYFAECKRKKEAPQAIGQTLVHTNRFGHGSTVQFFGKNGKALGQFHFKAEEQNAKQNPVKTPVAKKASSTKTNAQDVTKSKETVYEGFSQKEMELIKNL